jgi:DNA-directed RNA polymerase subunit E'/Rpb7
VSSHQIPGWNFDATSPTPCFVSEDETLRLEKDKEVRIRILGTNSSNNEFNAVGEFMQLFV